MNATEVRALRNLILFTILAKRIGFLIVAICVVFLDAFVISALWNWFLVPAFSLPTMMIKTAFALLALVALLVPPIQGFVIEQLKTDPIGFLFNYGAAFPLVSLFFGYAALYLS